MHIRGLATLELAWEHANFQIKGLKTSRKHPNLFVDSTPSPSTSTRLRQVMLQKSWKRWKASYAESGAALRYQANPLATQLI